MLKSFQAAALGYRRHSGHMGKALRRTALLAAISSVSMLHASIASALGMGDITLHSALNQPLNADIELVETGGLSAEDIVARLGSVDDFAKAGVERVFFYNDLRFTPIIKGNRGVIRVVSTKPVTEPYLNFLVQVIRPNGNLLHEYTVLLDPATSPAGMAATSGRNRDAAVQAAPESRMPIAPPATSQDKRYSVANGDTLDSIARRVQGNGANASAARMADGIQALNPQAFANGKGSVLKVGQNLLLPDAAVVPSVRNAAPTPVSAAPAKAAAVPAEVQRSAEQLATAAVENQQLNKNLDDLKGQIAALQEQMTGKDRQIVGLQTQLSEKNPATAPSAPVIAPLPVSATPPVAVEPREDSLLSSLLLPGAILVLLLLLGLAYSVRRNRRKQQHLAGAIPADSPLIKPAQAAEASVYEAPVMASRVVQPETSMNAPRPIAAAPKANSAPDALDGVSIYIAYGRFAEALGILRGALQRDPQRTDIRLKILELLAEQGDAPGFASEEQNALEHGVDPQTLTDLRQRYPQLKPVETSAAPLIVPAALAATQLTEPEPEPAQLDETAAAALNPESGDEFQLNLDDLSMDAEWDLVDPFDSPKPLRGKPEVEEPVIQEDLTFSSNLTELPEVFEIQDDQFLSDFSDPEPIVQSNNDSLDDAFLDGFMDDSSEFDLLDMDEAPLSKINQAQVLIDDGDFESARELLLEVMEDADEEHQQMARELLTSIS
ncbi:MAG TPA: FimV/HubP family polar landmark protein [Pseudomonas sp.]|uniref:FimV/HubP family polar landmark protein n=1 Tax=Pseudomonas sp. TaxID=306 RepID=UPI002ED7FB95